MTPKQCILMPANGMHKIAYTELNDALFPEIQLETHLYPPLQNPSISIPPKLTWHYFSNQIERLFKNKRNLYGVGHSIGGTLLLYDALKNPKRWKTLIIIEPALFSPWVNYLYTMIRFFRMETYCHPMIRLTNKRRSEFESKEKVFQSWRQRKVFQLLSDTALNHFIEASIIKTEGNYTLRFSKEWESAIYKSMCTLDPYIWKNIHRLQPKLIGVAAQTSTTFLKGARKKLIPYCTEWITITNTTHLLPFESPKKIAKIMKDNFSIKHTINYHNTSNLPIP